MATVTGLTAARMLAIEAASVVDGEINGSGHLILTRHDSSTIDAGYMIASVPDASTTVKGIVELATVAETIATIDAIRAVTPANLDGLILKTNAANGIAEAALITSYPLGISQMSVGSGSGWSLHGGFGLVVTHYYTDSRSFQFFHANDSNETWKRRWYTGAWGSWEKFVTTTYLAAMDSTQELVWGGDTKLYRSAANVLKTDDKFEAALGLSIPDNTKQLNIGGSGATAPISIKSAASTDGIISSRVGSETTSRYSEDAAGKKSWGDGVNAPDTTLYRSAAGVLKTDGAFEIGGIGNELFAYVSAPSETRTSNTTISDSTYLTVTLPAITAGYEMHIWIPFTGPAGNGLKWGWSYPSGFTMRYGGIYWNTGFFGRTYIETDTNLVAGTEGTSIQAVLNFSGMAFTTGTGGSLVFRWAQNSSNATAVTIWKGAFIKLKRKV